MNYHALNEFRAANEVLMDELLTDNVAALAAVGAIRLERVAQDGMRVQAAAGVASFRWRASLEEHLSQASELVRSRPRRRSYEPPRPAKNVSAKPWSPCWT